jgi:hypothetical protein
MEDFKEQYKPNSDKYRESIKKEEPVEKKVEKVISGSAKSKKKSEFEKMAKLFVAEDLNNLKSYILMGVLVPTIKKSILEILNSSVNALFGNVNQKGSPTISKISYKDYFERENPQRYMAPLEKVNDGYNYDEIYIESRGDAELVLETLNDTISQYGVVSVADYYDLVGIKTDNYTNNNYGWTNIAAARIIQTRDGYLIKLPKSLPISQSRS